MFVLLTLRTSKLDEMDKLLFFMCHNLTKLTRCHDTGPAWAEASRDLWLTLLLHHVGNYRNYLREIFFFLCSSSLWYKKQSSHVVGSFAQSTTTDKHYFHKRGRGLVGQWWKLMCLRSRQSNTTWTLSDECHNTFIFTWIIVMLLLRQRLIED